MGLRLDGLVVVVNGPVEVLLVVVGEAAVAEGGRVVGVDLEGLAVVGGGLVVLLLAEPGIAAVDEGVRSLGSNWRAWSRSSIALS